MPKHDIFYVVTDMWALSNCPYTESIEDLQNGDVR